MDVGETELAWEKGKRREQKPEISKKLKGKKKKSHIPGSFLHKNNAFYLYGTLQVTKYLMEKEGFLGFFGFFSLSEVKDLSGNLMKATYPLLRKNQPICSPPKTLYTNNGPILQ